MSALPSRRPTTRPPRTTASAALAAGRRARWRRTTAGAGGAAVAIALAVTLLGNAGGTPAAAPEDVAPELVAAGTNPVTPGNFTGFGFDQCETQPQAKMDAWLEHSPFLAVGVYISGNSRFCRTQRNLTPTWVSTQLAKGWRILPISLGPQSTCVGRFPRYGAKIDPTISNSSAGGYAAARNQGVVEANTAVEAARDLGIVGGSTLWYDLEGWSNYANATCRESALAFLSGWTTRTRQLGYVSGVYSSAGSGIKILDDARRQRRSDVVLPDRLWIARWDGVANTSTSYIAEDGWRPGNRMKQYLGGHNETHGGVTINIDSNWLDLGRSTQRTERHCGGVTVDLASYRTIKRKSGSYRADPGQVKALQCLLTEKQLYAGKITGKFNKRTRAAARTWQRALGFSPKDKWRKKDWMTLHAAGARPVLKIGSTGAAVWRIQRALRAAKLDREVPLNGVYTKKTAKAVKVWRKEAGIGRSKLMNTAAWSALGAGRR